MVSSMLIPKKLEQIFTQYVSVFDYLESQNVGYSKELSLIAGFMGYEEGVRHPPTNNFSQQV